MGRDWYWRRGAKPKPSSISDISKRDSAQTTTVSGCINAVFRLFGSYNFHWPLNHQTSSSRGLSSSSSSCSKPHSYLSQHTTTTTTTTIAQCIAGEEAPRNSLEFVEEASTSASLTSTVKEDEILTIPMGLQQIKTSGGDARSIANDTPRTNTPTLVARLMGLDLLPETPRPLQSKTRGGTRSLPETPRTSSARRSDVDHHRRLSLQINKENMSASEELVMSRVSSIMKRKEHRHEYEIVKHVKECVTRKVGVNITNRVPNREELISHFKYRKINDSTIVKRSTRSSSKTMESKSKPVKILATQHPKSSPRIKRQTSHKLQAVEEAQDEQNKQPRGESKCKKGSNKEFISRLEKPQQASEINRNKKEEPFVRPLTANRVKILDKKCRKTPLSNDLVPVKKYPSPQSTKIHEKQVIDAQRPKHSSHTLSNSINGERYNNAASTTTISSASNEAEYEYIARILRRTGLNKDTTVSSLSWFSPSHPLDPSMFHYLEHLIPCSTNDNKTKCGELRHRCNRKLLFHLVDELLTEILKPCFNMKPWGIGVTVGHGFSYMDGSQLIDMLCSKIRSFPRSDCRVLEDIDAVVGRDLPDIKLQSVMAYEEEGEGIVVEIEKDILEALLYEMVVEFGVRV